MTSNSPAEPGEKPDTRWHLSVIPLYVAIGSPGLLTTLVALSLGASVADIGVMTATAAIATTLLSVFWGRLSDFSGSRRKYLLFFFTALCPVFLALSIASSVPQLTLFYAFLVSITSGITPIAVMYTVESHRGKNWEHGVAKYNALTSIGNILGLLGFSYVAQFLETRWLFYISASMCLLALALLWRMGREPEITLERHQFPLRSFHDAERFLSPRPIIHYLDIRHFRIPRSLKELTPLHLLFLAAFVHWTGISFLNVGQTPLMRALGLSDSMILAVNCVAGAAQAVAFFSVARFLKPDSSWLLNRVVAVRSGLILCWAVLPVFIYYPVPYVFVFPLIVSVVWSIFYALIWLPVTSAAISQAPFDRKGRVQGELMSAIGVANAVGAYFGGLVISTFGYTVGFVLASAIALLARPIMSRIDMA